MLATFTVLAVILLVLRAGGESLGWGFQLQSPVLVTLLAYVMLLVGLSLSGVFSVGGGLMGSGQSLMSSGGLTGTFATGVLAAVVASPCTAPFMGAALGFAITRPGTEAFAVFLTLGAGFALPVLLLSLFPAWLRFIPKPGRWMTRFQQTLAFPLFATAAWLLWVLSQQTDARSYGGALAGLVVVAFAAWLYGQWRPGAWRLGLLGAGTAAALALAIGPMLLSGSAGHSRPVSEDSHTLVRAAGTGTHRSGAAGLRQLHRCLVHYLQGQRAAGPVIGPHPAAFRGPVRGLPRGRLDPARPRDHPPAGTLWTQRRTPLPVVFTGGRGAGDTPPAAD